MGHPTSESGEKRRLNGTSKVNTRTDRRTDRLTNQLIESIGPEGRCFENRLCHSDKELYESYRETNCITGSKVRAILLKGWILPISGGSSGRACACSLRSRLVLKDFEMPLS